MRVRTWMVLLASAMMVMCSSCESDNDEPGAMGDSGPGALAGESGGDVFCLYNIHYYTKGSTNTASYANYTDCPGHAFLPYNTKFKVSSWSKGFKLTAADTGMVISFEYKSANMGGMSAKDYISMITSPTPVSYTGLSPADQEGIQAGQAKVGMTKQGVTIALGYPAKHRTPSTDLNSWIYWKGRFNMLTVNFGEDGKVGSIM
jgi:hypothetical protein